GIPAAHQPRIFEKFYQVPTEEKHHSPGSGIGLSIVKEYVDLMGGTLELQSAEGAGTKFEIRIPVSVALVSPQEETVVPEVLLPHFPKGEKAHLLIVEDNEDLRQFL
ncbi:ATP-binding protein, partial [Arthrospira platensis SPKY1]|nr:ATP-binding protein [Arthrospira platensis SPKY1]